MKIVITFLCTCLALGLLAQSSSSNTTLQYKTDRHDHLEIGQGSVVDDLRKIRDPFDEIVISNGIQLHLVPQSDYVQVKAQKNILPLIATKVKNGKLLIHLIGSLETNKGIEVHMAMNEASALKLKEGSQLRMKQPLKIDKLEMLAESGSHVEMQLEANSLDLTLRSGTFMQLEGTAKHSEVVVKDGSILKAKNYGSNTLDVAVLGASICSIEVEENLIAQVESVSILNYYGTPNVERQETSAMGIINRK